MANITKIKAYADSRLNALPYIRRDASLLRGRIDRPSSPFIENWESEAINAAIWASTDPVTNPNSVGVDSGYIRFRMHLVANETGRLRSQARYRVTPNLYDAGNTIPKQFNMQWEMKLTDLTNFDVSACFFGLMPGVGDTRASQNIVGFGLDEAVAGVVNLTTVTDNGGSEEENVGPWGGLTLTDWNTYGIHVGSLRIDFSLNGVIWSGMSHRDTADLPDDLMYLQWYVDSEAGAGPTYCDIGVVECWYSDEV